MPKHSDQRDGRPRDAVSARSAAGQSRAHPKDHMPTWYLWYFAVVAFTIVTLSASLALNYSQSNSFRSAVDAHAISAKLLSRIAEVRALAIAVNAPGNDVFSTHDYVAESSRLDVAAAKFRDAYAQLLTEAHADLPVEQFDDLKQHIPRIETGMARMLNEARQIMSFLARGDADSAGRHMASMDREYAAMTEHISAMDKVIRNRQVEALTEQRLLGDLIQQRGLWLAAAALLMVIAAGVYGYRVVVAMRRDALRRRRNTRKLARARDQAEHAAKIKSQFLANMSHEIRTPMNGVLGMLDALSDTRMSSQQTHMLKTANDSAGLLLSIIDDILDFSKIEAGMLVIENMPLDLHEVVQQVVSLYNVRAGQKGIQLRFEMPENLPRMLCDPTRLTQLLSNFVSNAIKFTQQGEVLISVRLLNESPDSLRVRCAVSDNGIGIAPDAQRKLFAPFTQADGSTSRRFGGTGLGLAICKQLVTMLDRQGEIGVESVLGEGATFYFTLRLAKAKGDEPSVLIGRNEGRTRRFSGRVLVAEDNETNQQVAVTLLRSLGIEPVLAKDGREAVECHARERFDLILMDYHMPELDGCEATESIRAYESAAQLPRTPIVAVTASVLKEDKDRCVLSGMDDFLAKPIRQQSLSVMLSKWLLSEQLNTVADPEEIPVAADILDRGQFDEMRQISGEDFDKLLESFHASMSEGTEALRVAAAMRDAPTVKRAAHKMKGTAAALGATQLAEICFALETMGRDEKLDEAPAAIEKLIVAHAAIRMQFERLMAAQELNASVARRA